MTVPMIMYKAVDTLDNKMSLFAVRGDMMSVTTYRGENDVRLDPAFSSNIEMSLKTNFNRMEYPIVMLWSSEKKPVDIKPHITLDDGHAKLEISGQFDEDKEVSILIDQGFSSSIFHLSAEQLEQVSHHIKAVLETATLKVTMYKAGDSEDASGMLSYFAVRGDEMVMVSASRSTADWETPEGFGDFDSWAKSPMGVSRMINPRVIWTQ